ARLQDPRLLGGDRGDVVPEPRLVVERDRGDRRHHRAHEVGRVEASPEADLDDRYLDLPPGEPLAGEQGGELEVREHDAGGVEVAAQLRGELGDRLVRDGATADPDALGEVDEVGRGVEAGATAGGGEHRVQHRGGRALAIGARDVQRGPAPLRVVAA